MKNSEIAGAIAALYITYSFVKQFIANKSDFKGLLNLGCTFITLMYVVNKLWNVW